MPVLASRYLNTLMNDMMRQNNCGNTNSCPTIHHVATTLSSRVQNKYYKNLILVGHAQKISTCI